MRDTHDLIDRAERQVDALEPYVDQLRGLLDKPNKTNSDWAAITQLRHVVELGQQQAQLRATVAVAKALAGARPDVQGTVTT